MANISLPSSRKLGKATGVMKYQGNPCVRGHNGIRYVSDGKCVQCGLEVWKDRKEKRALETKRWRENNPERHKNNFSKWREKNSEYDKTRCLAWQKDNPVKTRAGIAKRKAAILQRIPKWADLNKIEEIYKKAAELRIETGVDYDVDHFYPLQGKTVSGLHVHTNLRVITKLENRKKSNKCPI